MTDSTRDLDRALVETVEITTQLTQAEQDKIEVKNGDEVVLTGKFTIIQLETGALYTLVRHGPIDSQTAEESKEERSPLELVSVYEGIPLPGIFEAADDGFAHTDKTRQILSFEESRELYYDGIDFTIIIPKFKTKLAKTKRIQKIIDASVKGIKIILGKKPR